MAELTDTDIRERVRERYAAATAVDADRGCCGSPEERRAAAPTATPTCSADLCTTRRPSRRARGRGQASLGLRRPTAVADLAEGETVLDLGSGAGADVLSPPAGSGPTARRSGST